MQLLLDTHVLLWWLQDSRKLPRHSRARIATAQTVYVSSISIWETAIKVQAGKLDLDIKGRVCRLPVLPGRQEHFQGLRSDALR
ncbi:type II toxin-antitoxin system VapC family toxin [Duganella sp. HH101]|uniref:type II toxin-antitoxin system VapC family toxin n=1 Tax=Duganella sp. HH101 TaxID=1781066 RepID=UPI0008FC4EB3